MNEEKKNTTKEVVIEDNEIDEEVSCNTSEPTADAIGPGILGISNT